MLSMFFPTLKVNQDIINKNYNELIQEWPEDPIHQIHIDCRRVNQSERNNKELIMSILGPECRFRDVFCFDLHLMVF